MNTKHFITKCAPTGCNKLMKSVIVLLSLWFLYLLYFYKCITEHTLYHCIVKYIFFSADIECFIYYTLRVSLGTIASIICLAIICHFTEVPIFYI